MSDKIVDLDRGCDLDSEDEIAELVRRFYADIAQDALLGHIFNDVAKVDWHEHIPKIATFWNRILLGIEGYTGDPIQAHFLVHQKEPFTHEHFRHWLEMFQETVDAGWAGPYAQEIKRKGVKIALVHSRALTGEPLKVLIDIEKKDKS